MPGQVEGRISRREHLSIIVVLLAGLLALAWLGLYNQPYFPPAWVDEGFVIQGALNLVNHGKYAMRSAEEFRVLDQPLVANGPGIVLPIAASFEIFGVGLMQARLVVVAFSLIGAVLVFYVTKQLFGVFAAAVALLLLLSIPGQGYVYYSRQSLGNVPAVVYFLGGLLLYLRAGQSFGWRSVISGALWAVAAITKGQFMLLLPALVCTILIQSVYFRSSNEVRKGLSALATMLVCIGMWYLAQWLMVGPEKFAAHMESVRSSSVVTVTAFASERIPESLGYLVRSGFALVVAPSLLFGGMLIVCRKPGGSELTLLLVLISIWLLWYVFVSIGWSRYAFDPYILGFIVAGGFWSRVIGKRLDHTIRLLRTEGLVSQRRSALVSILLLSILISVVGVGLYRQVSNVHTAADRSLQDFASQLNDAFSTDSPILIESSEWQIDVLSGLPYHHPTNDWVDRYTAVLFLGDTLTESYVLRRGYVTHLIDGPFSKFTGIYTPEITAGCCDLLFSVGAYDLYAIHSD